MSQKAQLTIEAVEGCALPFAFGAADAAGGKTLKGVANDLTTLWHGRTLGSIPLAEIEAIVDLTQRPGIKVAAITAEGTAFPASGAGSSDEGEDEDF